MPAQRNGSVREFLLAHRASALPCSRRIPDAAFGDQFDAAALSGAWLGRRGATGGRDDTVTLEVNEDGGLVDRNWTLVRGARQEGNLTAGTPVTVQISVFDKTKAVPVRASE
jgi:hypothetical protein